MLGQSFFSTSFKRSGGRRTFAVGISLFLAVSLAGAYAIHHCLDLNTRVSRASRTLAQIRRLQMQMDSAEIAARDLLLTHDEKRRQAYSGAYDSLTPILDGLDQAVMEHAGSRQKAAFARRLIDEHFAALDDLLTNPEYDSRFFKTDSVSAIYRAVQDLYEDESALLVKGSREARGFGRGAIVLLGLGVLFAVSLLLWSWRVVHRAAQAHEVHEQLLEAILASMGDGLMSIDHSGVITHANPAAEKLLGFSPQGLLMSEVARKVDARDAMTGGEVGQRNSPLRRALAGESRDEYELTIRTESGDVKTLSVSTRPVCDLSGAIVGALEVVRDITQHKLVEREWQAAHESALEASRLKSDFLANISHEIRTPMNGVLGMATLLVESPLLPQQMHFAKTIKSSTESLLALINQVLDHSRIESGALQLESTTFVLREAVEGVVTMLLYQARTKNLALELDWDPTLPAQVVGDPQRLRQVLIHLVSNALRYTVTGEVRLALRAMGGARVEFMVVDTGVGMCEKARAGLFRRPNFAAGGSYANGLGLILTYDLVNLMGGEISVESVERRGTTFRFTLELPPAAAAAGSVDGARSLSGHVLVAEDQKINQLVIEKFLARLGLTCETVTDGKAALERLQEKHFDLVLMDCHMRPMDGYEATRLIRESEKLTGKHMPILAITAEGQLADRTRCFEVGMDDVLSKPVELDRLHKVLSAWLPSGAATVEFDAEILNRLSGYDSDGTSLSRALAADYLQDSAALIEGLRAAVAGGDWPKVIDTAHALKGSSLTLGLVRVAALCGQWELAPMSMSLAELEDAWTRGCEQLRGFLEDSISKTA